MFTGETHNYNSMLNKFQAIGRIGKDPEVRRLDDGTTVAKVSLACSESWKDKSGEKQEKTEWFNLVLWRGLAEVAEKYVKKGMLVYIEGKVTNREYTDKDNNKKFFTEIVCSELKMLEFKKDGDSNGYFPPSQQAQPATADVGEPGADDQLPF